MGEIEKINKNFRFKTIFVIFKNMYNLIMCGWLSNDKTLASFKASCLSCAVISSMFICLITTKLFLFMFRYKVATPNAPGNLCIKYNYYNGTLINIIIVYTFTSILLWNGQMFSGLPFPTVRIRWYPSKAVLVGRISAELKYNSPLYSSPIRSGHMPTSHWKVSE